MTDALATDWDAVLQEKIAGVMDADPSLGTLKSPLVFDMVHAPPYMQIVAVTTASERQFRAAMEGECPGCGASDLERVPSENENWTWAHCSECSWAEAFRAVARTSRIIWRQLASAHKAREE